MDLELNGRLAFITAALLASATQSRPLSFAKALVSLSMAGARKQWTTRSPS